MYKKLKFLENQFLKLHSERRIIMKCIDGTLLPPPQKFLKHLKVECFEFGTSKCDRIPSDFRGFPQSLQTNAAP